MQKRYLAFLILFVLFPSNYSHAKTQVLSNDSNIPEQNGVYRDSTNPSLSVRVFVHKEKPQTTVVPALVCNLTDPDSNSVVSRTGWKLPSSVVYNLNPSSVPAAVGSANLPTMASSAFSNWTVATNNKVSLTRGANTTKTRSSNDSQNIIAWGRTNGSALGVTYTRYYTSSGLVVDVDTIMNQKFAWSLSNSLTCADSNSYDALDILTHELGHWFGMNDEYSAGAFSNATMYGYGSKGEVKKTTLTTGDQAGAFTIYNP